MKNLSMSTSFVGQISIPPNLLAIDGITRSGKFWLAELISYFEGTDLVLHEPVLDFISIKAYYDELDKTSATDLLRNIVSHKCFITLIGRNLNTRLEDSSSIYHHPRRAVFLDRVHQMRDAGFEKLKKVNFDEVTFPMVTHDWLSVWGIQANAFPAMKLIRVERNPIDLAYAWYETGIGLKEMAFSHRFTKDGKSVPWFANGFYQSFKTQSEVDRIINSIAHLFDTALPVMNGLRNSPSENILITTYERLGEDIRTEVERISSYIGLRPIPEMVGFLATQEKKGRSKKIINEARVTKLKSLKETASSGSFQKLLDLSERYEVFQKSIGM
jgi:hypothetical protein